MASTTVFIAVLFSILVTIVVSTPYKDCGSKGATIVDVKAGDCDKSPCIFKKGTNISFEMDFKANVDIKSAHTVVYAYIGPIKVPFSLPDPNSCHFMKCPVASGASDKYTQNFEILKSYPSVSVQVQWEILSGDTNEMLTCFKVSAKIE